MAEEEQVDPIAELVTELQKDKNLVDAFKNAPKDVQNLQKAEAETSYNLYYPLNLQDSTVNASSFNHAVSFVVYRQQKSSFANPFTGSRTALARGFEERGLPLNALGVGVSLGIRRIATLPKFSDRPIELAALGLAVGGTALGDTTGLKPVSLPDYGLGKRLKKTEQIITLYTPDTMVLEETHQYEQISLTSAAGMAGLLSFNSPSGGTLSEIAFEFASRTGVIGARAAEAGMAGLGYAINPMLELIYNGTQQRRFNFQFRFTPRNAKEAEAVMKIIQSFRFHAAAEYAGGQVNSRYFIPPSMFEIQFKHRFDGKLTDNVNLPRTAPCVLTSVNTNYAAGGNYVTFQDGVPAEITLDLAFTESVVLVKEDIKNGY